MEDQFFGFLALVCFGLPFVALPIIIAVKVWQKKKRTPGKPLPSMAASGSGNAAEAESRAEESAGPFGRLETIFPVLNQAAGDFLGLLSNTDFKGDLTLAAEMAGLKLLRNSGTDLGQHTPGHMLLGAVPDEAYVQMQRFIFTWCLSNGIPLDGFGKVQLPSEDKAYKPEVSRLEPAFDSVCQGHGLIAEDGPYAAALAALKLVAAGAQLGLMDLKTGQYMTYFHIVTASKMVPEPLPGA